MQQNLGSSVFGSICAFNVYLYFKFCLILLLRQGWQGNVIVRFVCLSVCEQDNSRM